MPSLRESYEDTLRAAEGADLLIGMHAAYATRLVAEKTGIPWASAVHIPMGFFSAYDPPILDFAPSASRRLRFLGSPFWRLLFWFCKRISRPMAKPWYQLRKEIGLPPTSEGNPLSDSHSPQLVLALFSRLLADRQADWPRQAIITGFPFFDVNGQEELPDAVTRFLDAGPPPIVFTLGSAVSMNPGSFYEISAKCSKLLNERAILVTGNGNPQLPTLPDSVIAVKYAPFSRLFPRASAIVHHGGVGTTGMAMSAGRPMLIVPNSWDQPDNAQRAVRRGIACTVSQRHFTPDRAAVELRKLLHKPTYLTRSLEVQRQLQDEDGAKTACNAVELLLHEVSASDNRRHGFTG